MDQKKDYIVGIYCRLSKDDNLPGESMSIGTQRSMLTDYCAEHGYTIYDTYVDDGCSGLNFERPGFQRLLNDAETGLVNMIITKDLSRLGRDYIMTGYYTEIYFPLRGIRYVALADGFDTNNEDNDIAPFKNILNDMYARDISKKIKAAKHQRAKSGLFISGQAPYGYKPEEENKNHLVIDPEAAQVVRLIYDLALADQGEIAISNALKARKILKPAAYKFQHNNTRFFRYGCLTENELYDWCPKTIGQILSNRVYVGAMINHKDEIVNYKTKQRRSVPQNQWIVVENTHEAIISCEVFERVQEIRSLHSCPARYYRENIFRGLLYCDDCGHKLSIAHRRLKYREEDLYRCMHHQRKPAECPKTHAIYHDALYNYVLSEIHALAKSMKRRKVQSPIAQYGTITELTPELLNEVILRIEVGHITRKANLKNVIRIQWKLM